MTTVKTTQARRELYTMIADVQKSHEPILITGKRGNAVLVSEEDWRSIEETLYLLSIPGMKDSIQKGMKERITKRGRSFVL